jgi:class 3 adenylate cyclase
VNEPAEKFCGECGAALRQTPDASAKRANDPPIRVAEIGAPENLDGERKTVTALFADIKGSTELAQDLDPEEARAVIDPALKLMIAAVLRYDGYVVQTVAATGTIAATEDTRKLCEGYFTFRSLGPTRVKGVSESVNVHEVTGLGPLRTHLQASVRRGLSRFVGREAELAQMLRQNWR